MHIAKIDLNLLVVLDTIHAEGGITKAAERLNLTQPAISHALARLRDLLGDPLFERKGYTMVPTPLTRRLIDPLRDSLNRIGTILNDVKTFDPETSNRRYVIGMRDFMESSVLPKLMQAQAAESPGISLSSVRVERRRMESELAAGTVDCALDMLLPVSDEIASVRIRTDELVVLARAGHPATRHSQIALDDYLKEQHVLVSSRRSGRGFEDFALRRAGVQRQIALRAQFHFAACRAVAGSDLLLTMPRSYAELANQAFDTVMVPFPVDETQIDTYLYWHTSMDTDRSHRWLRDRIMQAINHDLIAPPVPVGEPAS